MEPDSLVTDGTRTSVDVRIPWYRAIPASCISEVTVRIDGRPCRRSRCRCELNGRERRLEEFAELVDESWFTTDSLTVSRDIDVDRLGTTTTCSSTSSCTSPTSSPPTAC